MTLSEMKASSEENIVHKNSQNAGPEDGGADTGVVTNHGHVATNEVDLTSYFAILTLQHQLCKKNNNCVFLMCFFK